MDIRVLDVDSKQVSTFPGSQNWYDPRCSPDGQHMAALSAGNKKLVIYDFKTQKWSDWVTGVGIISTPIWSGDGKYVYFDNQLGEHPGYRRVKVGLILSFSWTYKIYTGPGGAASLRTILLSSVGISVRTRSTRWTSNCLKANRMASA